MRPAHSRGHLYVTRFTRRLQSSRYLNDRSGCFRLERVGRVGLSPTGKRRLCTAHVASRRSKSPNLGLDLPQYPTLLTPPDCARPSPWLQFQRATSARCWRKRAKCGMPDCAMASSNLDARPQMSASSDEGNPGGSCDRVDAIAQLFRRRPHNMIEKIEKLGFEGHADEQEGSWR